MRVRQGPESSSGFADLVRTRVPLATEGKDPAVGLKLVAAFEKHHGQRPAITPGSLARSPACQKGVPETCRHAQVVCDQFHGLLNVNQAVDPVRRGVWAGRAWGRRGTKASGSGGKHPEHRTAPAAARLAGLDQKSLRPAKAYQRRLVVQDRYRRPPATVARQRVRVGCRRGRWVARQPPKNLLRALVQGADGVEH